MEISSVKMTLRSIAILFSFISSGIAETISCWTNNDCTIILHECDLFECRIAIWRVIVLAVVIFIIFGVSYFIFWMCSNRNAPNNRFVPPQTLYQTNATNWPQTYPPQATNWPQVPQVYPTNATNWPQAYQPNATNWTQTYSTNATNPPHMDSSNTTSLPETDSPNTTDWPQTANTAHPPTGATHHRGCCVCQ